jgi:nucleolar protein 56
MPEYWFSWLAHDKGPDFLPEERISGGMESSLPDWRVSVENGLFTSREEYLTRLRSLCLGMGERMLASALQQDEEQILCMVRTLDEVSESINHYTERLVDWYRTYDPSFSRKGHILRERDLLLRMRGSGDEIFQSCVKEADRLLTLRTALSQGLSHRVEEKYPNCSALVGGLVAARLIARAGGLERLTQMSSSTIQVLGAENALFSHLHGGTPPPKHGIIYQHRRVHAAPRPVRGRVARVLAGRLALAVRLDYYRGVLVPDFIKESQRRIDRAGERR